MGPPALGLVSTCALATRWHSLQTTTLRSTSGTLSTAALSALVRSSGVSSAIAASRSSCLRLRRSSARAWVHQVVSPRSTHCTRSAKCAAVAKRAILAASSPPTQPPKNPARSQLAPHSIRSSFATQDTGSSAADGVRRATRCVRSAARSSRDAHILRATSRSVSACCIVRPSLDSRWPCTCMSIQSGVKLPRKDSSDRARVVSTAVCVGSGRSDVRLPLPGCSAQCASSCCSSEDSCWCCRIVPPTSLRAALANAFEEVCSDAEGCSCGGTASVATHDSKQRRPSRVASEQASACASDLRSASLTATEHATTGSLAPPEAAELVLGAKSSVSTLRSAIRCCQRGRCDGWTHACMPVTLDASARTQRARVPGLVLTAEASAASQPRDVSETTRTSRLDSEAACLESPWVCARRSKCCARSISLSALGDVCRLGAPGSRMPIRRACRKSACAEVHAATHRLSDSVLTGAVIGSRRRHSATTKRSSAFPTASRSAERHRRPLGSFASTEPWASLEVSTSDTQLGSASSQHGRANSWPSLRQDDCRARASQRDSLEAGVRPIRHAAASNGPKTAHSGTRRSGSSSDAASALACTLASAASTPACSNEWCRGRRDDTLSRGTSSPPLCPLPDLLPRQGAAATHKTHRDQQHKNMTCWNKHDLTRKFEMPLVSSTWSTPIPTCTTRGVPSWSSS